MVKKVSMLGKVSKKMHVFEEKDAKQMPFLGIPWSVYNAFYAKLLNQSI
jgi:hypothetical protein